MAKVTPKKKSNTGFLVIIGVVLVVGGAVLWSTMQNKPAPIELPKDAPAMQAEGYLRGNPNAPITIIEFADFECPGCGQFATIQGPDIKTRIVDAGLANFRFYDFPLTSIHQNTLFAHLAAACANDQGKFWEMHDQLFLNQPDWSGLATTNPRKVIEAYATAVGLDMASYNTCMDEQKHLARIQANAKEGESRGVNSTPTIIVGNKVYPGGLTADALKKIVDSLTAAATPAPSPAP
ncbi:DsbA family protein [Gemmatimonas sp.]